MYLTSKVFNPDIFQGGYKRKNYFEGWYFKLIDRERKNVLAVIPGVSLERGGLGRHAFVQVMDAHTCKSSYFKYDLSDFEYSREKFDIRIGGNHFSGRAIQLELSDNVMSIRGQLEFENIIAFPKKTLRPGIMGPYAFVPFMECYHGIVNIHQELCGGLSIDGQTVDFTDGYGYIEKDWGRSFPEAWIWLQSNHFGKDDVSLMFSLARIPWLRWSFPGFLSFIRIKDKMLLFATYTHAKIIELSYARDSLKAVVEDKRHKLELNAVHSGKGILKAPKNGLMDREILESITAVVQVRLSDRSGNILYEGEGVNTGLEIEEGIFQYFNRS